MTAVAEKAPLSADYVGRATRDCTRLPAEGLHEACKDITELRNELAVATEYERLPKGRPRRLVPSSS